MPVREFLRKGYQDIREPTVVTSRGLPLFTVTPGQPDERHFTTREQRDTLRPGPPGPSPNGG